MKKLFFVFILFFTNFVLSLKAQSINWKRQNNWVDSVYATLTLDQKIAQLFMIGAFSNKDKAHVKDISCYVNEMGVGGLIFFKGTPTKQAILTNYYQSISKVPLLIGIDGEWGLNMRLDSTPVFPRQMVFGGANKTELTKQFGTIVGKHCKRIGVNFNFAPDVDINNNMNNPVINDRSFGENKYIVAKNGIAYMQGMQNENIIASAKHFPGHGDTETDSHSDLPVIRGNRKRLDSLELYPFQQLIHNHLTAVMMAHLSVPALDSSANVASSLSEKIINNVLKDEMKFEGIVISDALNMKAVSAFYEPGEVAARAFKAGNDILLLVEDVPLSLAIIKSYLARGEITEKQLETSCKKVLLAKYWCGLSNYKPIETNNLIEDLNTPETDLLIKQVIKNGIVVCNNHDKLIPLQDPEKYKIACVNVGTSVLSEFQTQLRNYIKADYFAIDKNDKQENFDTLYERCKAYNLVIISLHGTSRYVSKNLGLTLTQIDFVKKIGSGFNCILVNNGNPYILQHFDSIKNIIVSYEDLPIYNQLAAQILGGGIGAHGKMPVSVSGSIRQGVGYETESVQRFEYQQPEEAKISSKKLLKIDSIVNNAIAQKAMPGCQVFISKNGKVIYNKSFGFHKFDSIQPVKNHHVYDLASMSKILGTTLAIMKLYENKKIKLDDKLSTYLPFLKLSNKEKITIREVLVHEAGLIPFIPFYKHALLPGGKLNPIVFSDTITNSNTHQVAEKIFINTNYEDFIFETIAKSELKKQGEYVYSDLGFILLRKLIEVVANQPFDTYLKENFYTPLNLSNLCFNPTKTINYDWIVPTEIDSSFRKQIIKGYVHDPTAAMLGGISGHAGLFANANDVAIIMQMLLNKGIYGNNRVLKASTIETFTKKQSKKSRRGLGFDKSETDLLKDSPTAKSCSHFTYGHQGFTGTCTWVDPEYGLVYVFLSNRTFPSSENKKFGELSVRTKVQEAIYEAIK